MRPELNAALTRYWNDRGARRSLLHSRWLTLAVSERLEVARILAQQGAHRAAALWWASACRQSSGDPRMRYRLANALRMAGRTTLAEKLLDTLCEQYPEWPDPAHSLAWLYRRRGETESAADAMEGWFRAAGSQFKSLFPVSAFLQDMGLIARAESLLAGFPDDAQARAERGMALVKLGRFDQAEGILRKVVQELPSDGGAWIRLAATRRWRNEADSPRALMEEGLRKRGLDDETRAAIGFALAKVDDDLGRYAEAWQALELANALRNRSAQFNPSAWRKSEEALYRVFTADFIKQASAHGGREAPVFIVGMPRSGTTLLERRLGRHSALVPVGELEVIEAIGIESAGRRGYPVGVAGMTARDCAAAANRWRPRLPPLFAEAATIVDKNPLNFLHAGWIACLFPQARIIHCRRDPLDTVLSLWFQNFAHKKNDYAYRKEGIVWMYGLYRRLMTHWERVLPGRIRNVDYERVVTDPEAELRALVEWLGLDWQPAIISDSPSREDVISTASVWQARQPIYGRSVGRASHYEPWISEFRDALRAAGVSSGGD